MLGRIIEIVDLKAIDKGIDSLLVAAAHTSVDTAFDDGIHPAVIGVGDGARKGLDEILVDGRRTVLGDITERMAVAGIAILPGTTVVGAWRNLTERYGIGLGLMQDMRELVVHRVELVLVQIVDILVRIAHTLCHTTHLVDLDQRNLHTSGSIAKDLGTRGRIALSRSDEVEDTGAIGLHEDGIAILVLLAVLIIYVIEQVLDEVGQKLRLLIVGRCQLIRKIGSSIIELILDLGVIGNYEIVVEPLVKGSSR